MAAGEQLVRSKKRKRDPSLVRGREKPNLKHLKNSSLKPSKPQEKISKKLSKPTQAMPEKLAEKKQEPRTPKERRLAAKEMAEARKKKRKPNFSLEKELASLWEKMRCYNIDKEERSKLVSGALQKMSGKFLEIAGSHVSARVLQTCVKYCSQAERDIIFEALRPHLLTLSRKKYAVHLVKKLLDTANKKQLEGVISSLHGHVASLLRHAVGSAVVEHVHHLASASQRQSLLMELYSPELQLFKDLTLTNAGRLVDVISKLGLLKSSVLQHMTSVIQPLLEKGIIEYSIIHAVLVEYFTIADRSSAADLIQQLSRLLIQEASDADESEQFSAPYISKKMKKSRKRLREPLLVRIIRTRDGLKVGILCIKHGSAKERKRIVKGTKGHIRKLALDQYGSLLLICILSVVDDTKLVSKIIIHELQTLLPELVLDKNGRRLLLQLLHPQCPRYLSPDDLACLNLSAPSLCSQGEEEAGAAVDRNSDIEVDAPITDRNDTDVCKESMKLTVGGKKDPFLRRYQLLVESGLAESLIETCIENIDVLLRSNFGKEVIYEVAVGGTDGVLRSLADRLDALHKAIASRAALPKANESEEHVFENFHSSRLIRKLVLDCASFAATLWEMALKGKCEMWAQSHSCKVVSAFLESSDSKVRDLAKSELQPLIDRSVVRGPDHKTLESES